MSAIQILATQEWVERLGFTLLHFLWQGGIIATIYGAVRLGGRRALGPNGRYAIACAALAAMAVVPVVTWFVLSGPAPDSTAATFAAPLSTLRVDPPRAVSLALPGDLYPGISEGVLSWVVAIWLVGATVFSLRLLGGWMLAERLRHRMTRPAPAEWQRTLDRFKDRLSISPPVRLLVSGVLQAPAAIGWLRPIVLVPAGALAGLPPAQMEALLVHELAHIRRRDYLVHIVQSAAEAILFYHPAVWWISGHVRAERELCCDDIAVSMTGDAVGYARALAEFDATRWVRPTVMAANNGPLAARIRRLLGQPPAPDRISSSPASAAALLGLAIGGWVMLAQSADRPQFEAASIKPSNSQSIQYVRPLPGRLTADASLQDLTQHAYGVPHFRVVGGADRVMSVRYQIEATPGGNTSRDRMFLMLRSLLEDRFRLKIHRETREQAVFTLVAARSGLKLPPPKDGGCVESPAEASPEWTGGGRMAAPGELPPTQTRCGSAGVSLGPAGARLQGGRIAMAELGRILSMLLGRSVIDRTGFTEVFDLQVDFVPDESTSAMPPPPPGAGISGAPIAQALQQQLGLRLESGKGPVEVIVVDHAEAPSGN
jgi:uncharacterized protein (TIGR03435 family)